MATLAYTFVNAGIYGFLGAVFTRDAFFATATYLTLWLLAFAPIQYQALVAPTVLDVQAFIIDAFLYIPAAVIFGSAIGIGFVRMLDIGQLVDVWLTGSGGATIDEELPLPLIVVSIVFALVGVVFIMAGYHPAAFMYQLYALNTTVAYIFGSIFLFIALVTLGFSARQRMPGTRFAGRTDGLSVMYALVFVVLVIVHEFLTLFTDPSLAWNVVLSALGLAVLDIILLAVIGYYFEQRQPDGVRGRFFLTEPRFGLNTVLRILAFVVVHVGLFYGYGNATRLVHANNVRAMFGHPLLFTWPTFSLLVLVLGILFTIVYIVYTFACKWPQAQADSDKSLFEPLVQNNPPATPAKTTTVVAPMLVVSDGQPRRRRNAPATSTEIMFNV